MSSTGKKDDSKTVENGDAVKSSATSAADTAKAEKAANVVPSEPEPDNSSKLRTFLGILRRFVGGKYRIIAVAGPDVVAEYWNYLDRPEAFVSMGNSEDEIGRMLGVLRFWFTKDLKHVKGKPCKPYNSTLGEFFRDVMPGLRHPNSASASSATSASSTKSTTAGSGDGSGSGKPVRLSYLTEQTSHHPPVSAWYVDCPEKQILARGYDQIAAKFTGTSIRVAPGSHNHGIFINLKRWNEEYNLTHPSAHLGGLLRGTLRISVADSCFVTCPQTKMKCILEYLEDGWISRSQDRVNGVIFRYDPKNDIKGQRIKDVNEADVLLRIEGCWTDKIYYTLGSAPFSSVHTDDKHLMIDIVPLQPADKQVPAMEDQLPNESRRFWKDVTSAILNKQYSLATDLKVKIEERQRAKALERKEAGIEWKPRFFTGAVTPVGKPELTRDGEEALKGLNEGNLHLDENKEYGA